MRLKIELIPNPTMNINLRAAMSKSSWTKLSRELQKQAKYQCEICHRKKAKKYQDFIVMKYGALTM